MQEEQSALDFFAGGVPAFEIFRMNLESIAELLHIPGVGTDRTVQELAYIGVVSYTEAFFKDHFAAVLNILPEKTAVLRDCGRDVAIDLTDLLGLDNPLHNKFGFLLSERFNFGTPKAINALYRDLLLITPFSTDKALAFDKVLATRNLLVHHGGILTMQFNRGVPAPVRERTYFDSVSIRKERLGEIALLALDVIKGTVIATASKLSKEIKDFPISDIRHKALRFMEVEVDADAKLSSSLNMLITGESPFADSGGITDEDVPF
jgi:hypothetical protein